MTPLKVCARVGCNNVFDAGGARKYCCAACRQSAYRSRYKTENRGRLQKRKNCFNCGKIFYSHIRTRHYCTDACKQRHYRDRLKLMKEELK